MTAQAQNILLRVGASPKVIRTDWGPVQTFFAAINLAGEVLQGWWWLPTDAGPQAEPFGPFCNRRAACADARGEA